MNISIPLHFFDIDFEILWQMIILRLMSIVESPKTALYYTFPNDAKVASCDRQFTHVPNPTFTSVMIYKPFYKLYQCQYGQNEGIFRDPITCFLSFHCFFYWGRVISTVFVIVRLNCFWLIMCLSNVIIGSFWAGIAWKRSHWNLITDKDILLRVAYKHTVPILWTWVGLDSHTSYACTTESLPNQDGNYNILWNGITFSMKKRHAGSIE